MLGGGWWARVTRSLIVAFAIVLVVTAAAAATSCIALAASHFGLHRQLWRIEEEKMSEGKYFFSSLFSVCTKKYVKKYCMGACDV